MGALEDYKKRNYDRELRKHQTIPVRWFGSRTFRHPDRAVRFTWWVAVFTCCLVIVGGIQAIAFIASERAFLFVRTMQIASNGIETPMLIHIEISNNGRSAATGTVSDFIRYALDEEPDYKGGKTLALAPIPAGSTYLTTFTLGFPAEVVTNIRSGAVGLNIYGVIEYTDDFSLLGSKKIGFCYTYNPKGDPKLSTFDTCRNPKYTYVR